MTEGNSLLNLGDLSKPATVLIERISDAVGAIYKPRQIKRIAKAEAEAEKIKTLAQIEINEIQQRALVRLIEEEGKKQENMENIIGKSIGQLNADANPDKIDDDWLASFFDKCKIVSEKQMQGLWSRVLAGEANKPGTYSMKTIDIISTLDKNDAQLFTSLCSFGIYGGATFPIILDENADIYNNRGITFSSLAHLEYIGLIKFDHLTGFVLQNRPKTVGFSYYSISIIIELPNDINNTIELGKVLLTKTGQELAPICGSTVDMAFFKYLVEKWKEKGYQIHTTLPNN